MAHTKIESFPTLCAKFTEWQNTFYAWHIFNAFRAVCSVADSEISDVCQHLADKVAWGTTVI